MAITKVYKNNSWIPSGGGVIKTSSKNKITPFPANVLTTVAEVTGLNSSNTYLAVATGYINVTVGGTKPALVWRINNNSGNALHTIAAYNTGDFYFCVPFIFTGATSIQFACLGGGIGAIEAQLNVCELVNKD